MKKWKIVTLASWIVTGGSAFWLWLLKQDRIKAGLTEREVMIGPDAKWVLMASAGFILGLFVIFPISLYFEEKEEGRVGGPVVSDSLRKPFITILYVAFAIFLLIAIAVWAAFLTGKI